MSDRRCNGMHPDDGRRARPLGDAFNEHTVMKNSGSETLCCARFVRHEHVLLRRESTFNGDSQGSPLAFLDKIALGRIALRRLRDYGIAIPPFAYVIADSKELGRPCLYSIIEFVEGENITDIKPMKRAIAREVEGVFVKFLTYLRDARTSGEPFWTDFNIHQFMYGTVQSDPSPRCYLIDIEPYAGRWPIAGCSREAADLASRSYLMQLMRIYLDVEWFESHGNRGIMLLRARALLLHSVRAIPSAPIYDEFRENLLLLLTKGSD